MNSSPTSSPDDRNDPFDLDRFVSAQRASFETALAEVKAGKKQTHWMWFIFPQLRGLGRSSTSQFFGISGIEEARAYLEHDTLGPRLIEVCQAALAVENRTAAEIFGTPDDMKLRSCATLFATAGGETPVFKRLLDKFFDGRVDQRTLDLLAAYDEDAN